MLWLPSEFCLWCFLASLLGAIFFGQKVEAWLRSKHKKETRKGGVLTKVLDI